MANNIFDEGLKFIQQNFNTDSKSFKDIINSLDEYGKLLSKQQVDKKIALEAGLLTVQAKNNELLYDIDNYNKFEKLGNFGFESVNEVYKVIDEIIYDVRDAKVWTNRYSKWLNKINKDASKTTSHVELIELGKKILLRAVELAPIDTGLLRQSGILVDMGTYIIIAFTAPYSGYVHEDMNARHETGRAKFLEIALQEVFPDRGVWVERHGENGVQVKISVNPLYVEYKHYD